MKKTLITLFFALATSAGTLFAQSGTCGYNLTWTLNNGTLTISGTGEMTNYGGSYAVPWYDYCSSITTLIINSSVTSIGQYAFYGCSSLTSITIPNSVKSIGEWAFFGCSSLTSITIPNSVTSIGGYAFQGCTGLTSVTIPNSVTSIGQYAFYGCSSLTSIMIPNSVTSIGSWAFRGCSSLTSVTIPNSVTSIGYGTFYGCSSLTTVTIPNSVTSIGYAAFYECTGLTSVTIPNSVTSIGEQAFYGCNSLTSLTIPNSVTSMSIGYMAFCNCSSLTAVTIPNSVTIIGSSAFSGCGSLTSISIPNSVISIGEYAFSGCISLTSITIPNSVTSIGEDAFRNVPNIVYSGTVTGAPWGARSLNGYVEGNLVYRDATKTELLACSAAATGEIIIPNTVTSIGEEAFCGCTGLTSITIPNSVTSIGEYAFLGCSNQTSIRVSQGNAVYDSRNNCNAIIETATNKLILGCQNTVIPNSVTSIGSSAFYNCTSLTFITIPNSVTSIGELAFGSCSSLTSITIPNSVTSIGKYAFFNCDKLNAVHISDIAAWCAISFSTDYDSNPLYYAHNLYLNGNLVEDLTIPNNVTSIGGSSFSGCVSLTSVTIPNSVTSIGEWAFFGCSSLTSIAISNSVTSIGYEAFWGCSSLENIFVPCGELERFTQMFESYNYSHKLKAAPSPYTITIKDAKYGYVSVPDYNSCNESIVITAIPDPYCRFVKWSDGDTNNSRTVYLTNDQTFEAFFDYPLTDQCGKDKLLTWTLDTLKMAMEITGRGALSENYTYSTTFASLTVGNEVTAIGASAFSGCNNLKNIILGSALKVIESGAFACSDIKTITCYSQRPPTVNNGAFCNLDYETIIYVPKDYVSTYLAHAFWGVYDVRPIGASGTETDQVKVEPAETTATVAWPTINGAGSYELVIRDKDGNALCTLVFNAQGQLTSIDFAAAPARDRSNVAAMAQGAGFAFTVTGLESGTMYKYSFITKNASGAVIDTKTGAFTTQSPTALEDIMDDASSTSVRKVLQNGRLYILRDGKAYNATGAEVK